MDSALLHSLWQRKHFFEHFVPREKLFSYCLSNCQFTVSSMEGENVLFTRVMGGSMPAQRLLLPGDRLPVLCQSPARCYMHLTLGKGIELQHPRRAEAGQGRAGGGGVVIGRVPVTQARASGSCQQEAGNRGNL